MLSSKQERIQKAEKLIQTLVGDYQAAYRCPPTLPKGVNYDPKEWRIIVNTMMNIDRDECSIQDIWALERIETKYSEYLYLKKLES